VSPFRILLNSISSALSYSEVSEMKFLCGDKIPKGKREKVQSGQDLSDILMELQLLGSDNLEFLKTLLKHIKRDDLVARLVQFEEEGPHDPDDQPDAHEKPVAVICKNVMKREWKRLMRELGMPEEKLDRIEAAHPFNVDEQLVQALREWQRWKGKDAKVADLINALRGCYLNLVADKIEE
ncbi:FADD protein, partial [Vireo altiloquus]|nr:FADD protein [Vireo altiloquus]